ncbi:hypothetical protein VZ95_03085 [Elstera litoralis]|uniref:Anti-sigma factor NepR domain-containing protein n=1 Tax=Elstera litoralis TaxID=552518 RepID=A0A0F3IVQ7_9PROT|nr:NepR family anti-sigma factor [Elstera litoralis]KJV10717.1 hypothetical protein VZ95_03085 [Elstera litoralis]
MMSSSSADDDRPGRKANGKFVEPKLQIHIGRKLREYYAEIAAEPVPDRFKALLDQLEKAEVPAGDTPTKPTPGETE